MPTASWPSELEQVVDGDQFSYTFGETRQRSDMQNGPAKLRRKTTTGVNVMTGKMTVPYSLFDTFKTFYNTTINGGTDIFTMTHPISGSTATFRFLNPPSLTHLGGINFTLQLTLEEVP